MRPEQRGWAKRLSSTSNWQQEETLAATKPFDIPKLWVAKAFQAVKANGGAAGVDGVSLEVFERSLKQRKAKATRTNKSFIGVLWSAWSDGVVAHWVELIALEVEAAISSFTDLGPPQTRFTRSCVCPKFEFGHFGRVGVGAR